jgi:protocatechuate 3,4-dioxygenase beta subunit
MADPTRRRTLILLASAAAVGCGVEPEDTTPRDDDGDGTVDDCGALTSTQTEGPYYPGRPEARADITRGIGGVPLAVDIQVVSRDTCEAVVDAEVDLWGADAGGNYSGYSDFDTEGQDFMRGRQTTDADGVAAFTAIVPGSYPGRAVHLHVKVRSGGSELTTQVYFPDAMVREVLAAARYGDSARQTDLAGDGFYVGDTLMTVTGSVADGYTASVVLVV